MDTAHTTALQAKHAALEGRIHAEELRPMPDAVVISTLKKQKLRLKEELSAE